MRVAKRDKDQENLRGWEATISSDSVDVFICLVSIDKESIPDEVVMFPIESVSAWDLYGMVDN